MKSNKTILNSIFFIIISLILIITPEQVDAAYTIDNGDGTITAYAEGISDLSSEDIEKVVRLNIKNSAPTEAEQEVIKKCKNVYAINISTAIIDDLSFINDINYNTEVNIYIIASKVNLKNLNNSKIVSLNLANSKISNFKQIEKITSLKGLGLSETSGYEQIDYTKLPNLTQLTLATYIEDFDKLTSSIPNVTSLSLSGSNIQNKDTVYLERLTNLNSLHLNQTYLTDIDFVKKLPNLEYLDLPWSVTDLTPIYDLPKLNTIRWEAYTELFVTQELVDYLDQKNIWHYTYNSNIKEELNKIIKGLNINEDTPTKDILDKITKYLVENTEPDTSGVATETSALDAIILEKKGVCYQHSVAVYVLAKLAGVDDVYAVSGILMMYMNPDFGYDDDNPYSYGPHAWNIVNDQGIWYGVDAAQINNGSGVVNETLYKYNFWKNPLEDNDFDVNYANANYLDFNYFYAGRHIETDGTLKQTQSFQFKDITGLDIKNHTIYQYDTTDTNATKLCNKVLDNYTCHYIDTDSNNKISTGDNVIIKKNNVTIETFTLSTEKWTAPVQRHLGKITLKYTNYPNEINGTISTLYYNENNSLKVIIKGENYDENQTYKTTLTILGTDEDKTILTKELTLTGKQINEGTYITVEGGVLTAKEESGEQIGFGVPQYLFTVVVDGEERMTSGDYIKEIAPVVENPNTSARTILLLITVFIISTIICLKTRRKMLW